MSDPDEPKWWAAAATAIVLVGVAVFLWWFVHLLADMAAVGMIGYWSGFPTWK